MSRFADALQRVSRPSAQVAAAIAQPVQAANDEPSKAGDGVGDFIGLGHQSSCAYLATRDADYVRRFPSMIGNYREISEMYVDLSNPLAVVTPTLDAPVLLALAATTGWATGAQVHRMAGAGSDDGVRRVLARLVDQGIVLADPHPHATLYLLNRNHVAANAIVSLTRLRAEIIDRIVATLKSWSPSPPRHASLFGSFARGEATTDSDIDLLIVSEAAVDADLTAEAVDELIVAIRQWTGNNAHIVERRPDELAEMITADDPLVASWRADHIDLVGARLLHLLRDVRRAS